MGLLDTPVVVRTSMNNVVGRRISSRTPNDDDDHEIIIPVLEHHQPPERRQDHRHYERQTSNTPTTWPAHPNQQLEALKNVVHQIATKDGMMIDRQSFIETFDMSEHDLSDFEFDEAGQLDGQNLLIDAALESSGMEDQDRLRFIFNLFDTKGRGRISQRQIGKLLHSILSNSKISIKGMDFEMLATTVFERAGARGKQDIGYDEFYRVFEKYSVDDGPCGSSSSPSRGGGEKKDKKNNHNAPWSIFLEKHRLRLVWLAIYFSLCSFSFAYKAGQYPYDPVVGVGLQIARGSAQVIMLNFLFVLLPMCRSVVGMLKTQHVLWHYVPFDDSIEFHKLAGTVLLTSALVHTGAHVSNELNLFMLASHAEKAESFIIKQVSILTVDTTLAQTLATWPIISGLVLLLIVLIAFPLAAIPKLRQGNFNLFWYSHMLFGPFLILGVFHGVLSWLARWQAYWWIGPPLVIYLVERRFRYAKKILSTPVTIEKAVLMDQTLGTFMTIPPRFYYRSGMYVYLNCPALSKHEWHPFTLSSAPGDPHLSVHIQRAGDWTGAFHDLVLECSRLGRAYPRVYLDGPVGAPTTEFNRYKTIVLVGGGIGVTPFASIMKSLVHLWNDYRCHTCHTLRHPESFRVQKIYFYWVTRAQDSLLWFEETMNDICKMDVDHILEARMYLTSVKDVRTNAPLKLFQALIHDISGHDFVSGLKSSRVTTFGRPDWDEVFDALSLAHAGEDVGVFYCGPSALEKVLEGQCLKYSTNGGTFFDYHSEKF